ncbi:HEAT repeat domain-containing protein [Leptothoe kymatousa]|uniref:HEAT repeat domain-containing protein n=1 Tax=Leptothoe kymatousa TAU-MAC 1615 TaxID=2364775 RepID=A0ABS5Y5M2_9CYAN|nr:HEAT repeat domain-containing protein [Leptothoe kymatousa]MBT9313152.1 HEAT repeat domain-containing protein [Leptothoe kymatousa TAU-MAC 1615]
MPQRLKTIFLLNYRGLALSVFSALFLASGSYAQPNSTPGTTSSSVSQAVQQSQPSTDIVFDWFKENWIAILPILTLSGVSIAYLSILWKRPLWLLHLPAQFSIPSTQITLTPDIVLWLKYRPKVLDAWVDVRIEQALTEFESRTTVEERLIHISLPVSVDRKTNPQLTAEDLQTFCKRQLFRLVIVGEGGIGKTSLACQIAKWSMAEVQEERICAHRMIPVLIEEELDGTLLDAITLQIRNLRNDEKPVSEELLNQLLEKRRVLVIVDHLSEMSEKTRKAVRYKDPKSPVNALIVTSRLEDILGREVTQTTIKPQRVSGKQLSIFMDDYLKAKDQRELFEDEDYFDALRRLSQLVTEEKEITVLLARLYADQMISVVQDQFINDLPTNITDLILSYLNELNRNVQDGRLDDTKVQQNAKVTAWECLKNTLKPETANREQVIEKLLLLKGDNNFAQEQAKNALDYLEKPLSLIRTISPAKTRIRFTLDPLAEYLAALHLVERLRDNENDWQAFFQEIYAKSNSLEEIQGFLLALRNCCEAESGSSFRVPESIIQRLEQLAGLDPEVLATERLRRRIRRLMSDLSVAEPEDRQRAAREIGKIGADAKDALTALIKTAQDLDGDVRASAIQSIGKLGQSSELVVHTLMQASEDTEPHVRAQAVSALVELSVVSNSTQMRFLELLGDADIKVQTIAILGLEAAGKADEATLKGLRQMLESSSSSICLQAAKTLMSLEQSDRLIIQAIINQLDDEDYRVRIHAAELIGELDSGSDLLDSLETVLEKLEYLLNDRAPGVRTSAAKALIKLDQESEFSIKGLLALLKDTNANVRSDAAQKLGILNNGSREVVEELEGLLNDKDYQVRASAAEALGKLDRSLPSVLEKLTLLLDDKYPEVQSSAAEALGNLGNSAKYIIERLLSLLKNKNQDVQISAICALGKLHNIAPLILQSLTEFLDDANPNIRFQAASALLKLEQTSSKVVDVLCEQLLNGTADNRLQASELLGAENVLSGQLILVFLEAIQDKDIRIQSQSAYALAELKCGSASLINTLIQLLKSEDFKIVEKSIQALGKLGSLAKDCSGELLYFLDTNLSEFNEEEVENLRYEAREALIEIGSVSEGIIHKLFELFSGKDEDLRRDASKILESILEQSDIALNKILKLLENSSFELVKDASNIIDSFSFNSMAPRIKRKLEDFLVPLMLSRKDIITTSISTYFLVKFELVSDLVISEISGFIEDGDYGLPTQILEYLNESGDSELEDSLDVIVAAIAHLLRENDESKSQLEYIFRAITREAYLILEKRIFKLFKSENLWIQESVSLILLSNAIPIDKSKILEIVPSIIEVFSDIKKITESNLFQDLAKKEELKEAILSIRKTQDKELQVKCIKLLLELDTLFEERAVTELTPLLEEDYIVRVEVFSILQNLYNSSGRVLPLLGSLLKELTDKYTQRYTYFTSQKVKYIYMLLECLNELNYSFSELEKQNLSYILVKIFDRTVGFGIPSYGEYRNYFECMNWLKVVTKNNLSSELIVQRTLRLTETSVNTSLRCQAIDALGEIARGFEQVFTKLLFLISYEDDHVRHRIIRTIGNLYIDSDIVLNNCLSLSTDKDPYVRYFGVSSIGRFGKKPKKILTGLEILLSDEDIHVRLISAQTLLRSSVLNRTVINTLIELICDEDNNNFVRTHAIRQLCGSKEIGIHYKAKLCSLLSDKEISVRLQAAQSLLELGITEKKVVNTLLNISLTKNEEIISERTQAIKAIGSLEELENVEFETLLPLLDAEDVSIRIEVAKVLLPKKQYQELAINTLLSVVNDVDLDSRYDAIEALGELQSASNKVSSNLIEVLNDSDIYIRVVATETLIALNKVSQPVIDVLASLLKHETSWIRRSAIDSIGKLKDTPNEEILVILKSYCLEDDWHHESLESLYQLSVHSDIVELDLKSILNTDNADIQRDFIRILENYLEEGKIKETWISQLIPVAYGTDEDCRRDAISALYEATKTSDFASQQFVSLLKSNNISVIQTVCETLYDLKERPPESLLKTFRRLIADDNLLVSSISAYFLVLFGVDAPVANLLKRYLIEENYEVPEQVLILQENLQNGLDFIIAAVADLMENDDATIRESTLKILESIETSLPPLIGRMFGILEEDESYLVDDIRKILIALKVEPTAFLEKKVNLIALDTSEESVNYNAISTLGEFSRLSDLAANSLYSAMEKAYDKTLSLSIEGSFEEAEEYFSLAGEYFQALIEDHTSGTEFISKKFHLLLDNQNLLIQGIAAYGLLKMDANLDSIVEKLRLFIARQFYDLPLQFPDGSGIVDALDLILIGLGRLLDEENLGLNLGNKVREIFTLLPDLVEQTVPRLQGLLASEERSIYRSYKSSTNILVQIDLSIPSEQIVNLLIPLLKDESSEKRVFIVGALEQLNYVSETVVHELSELLWDEDQAVRDKAINAITTLKGVSKVEAMLI